MPSPIRLAREEDVPALLDIYAPYVTGTTASFEYQVPSCEEFARRLREVSACYPYLVWEEQGACWAMPMPMPMPPAPPTSGAPS